MKGFEGTAALLRLAVRRDRVRLPFWVLGIGGITFGSGSAMGTSFPTQRAIDAYAASASSSAAIIAMSGPPLGLDTLAGIVLNKIELVTVVGVCLMAALTVVRHTRAEEEEGRTELLRAGVVGRHAGGAAALGVASGASVLVGVLVALGLVGASVPAGSAVLYGAGTAALGIVLAAATLCLAQLFTHGRAVTGVALGLIGVAYVFRAAGDVRGDGLVWLSPIGWSQATHVLGEERWWPLLVCLATTAVLAVVAVRLSGARDVGAGVVPPRDGAAAASRSLSGALGLAVRLQRGSLAGWAAGVLAMALATGSLSSAVERMARDNPTLETYLRATGQGSFVDAFLSVMLLMLALLATGFAVSSATRLRAEEAAGRVEPLLATGLSRARWLASGAVVTLGGALLLLVLGGLGLGLSYAAVSGDGSQPLRLAGLALVYAPAVLSVAALAVLVLGWRPEWTGVAWAALGVCFVLGWLGDLLGLPAWLLGASPFGHVSLVPVEPLTWAGPVGTLLVTVVLAGLGAVGLRRRDIG
ncbi:MAG: ABC transporter permease [Nocardioidaceae bacterium]